VEQRGPVLAVSADGKPLVTFTDTERPYREGRVGAYTEDATVKFEEITSRSG
jgi:hypothetical protein